MPVRIPPTLPAWSTLERENVFVIDEASALRQDIRPAKVAILNLMPTKIATETQLLRLLSNSPLQVDVTLLHTATRESKNTDPEHLLRHYKTFDQIREQEFDGLIITGAPVELLPFEEVEYWAELKQVLDWSKTHVTSTLCICWAAQAGLYHFYGVPKFELPQKMFGVFEHDKLVVSEPLLRGFDDLFPAPHSRHTEVRVDDILSCPELRLLASSEEAGVYIVSSMDRRHLFVTGHSEYDPLTLHAEYERDRARNLPIAVPKNYYPKDDPSRPPRVSWRAHGALLFANWLNYYVYQKTSLLGP